ncbi:uncharacterized protein LOC142332849 isoform X2 [Lycorma delicatula]|uniref:uncharacterized protein LOC142332849 isoform X2 n=1 Tax=Lycorma delicatula TaxID=130591 RepID=UPI003F51ABFB
MKNIRVSNMIIKIYFMIFFIFIAVKANEEKYSPSDYNNNEKYKNLQASCQTFVNSEDAFTGYLAWMYKKINDTNHLLGCLKESNLNKLKNHEYYKKHLIQLSIFGNENKIKIKKLLPTLVKLLGLIPSKIMIKGGIINTPENAMLSGIDITETKVPLSSRLPCDDWHPEENVYADVEFVTMKDYVLIAYFKCPKKWIISRTDTWYGMKSKTFFVRPEETEVRIIQKTSIPCTLRVNKGDRAVVNNVLFLSPTLDKNLKDKLNGYFNTHIKFELNFSYICKFVSPLQAFKGANRKIWQYKLLNFTVSGYQLQYFYSLQPTCVGLTYCLRHQIINHNEYPVEGSFFHKIDSTQTNDTLSVINAVDD